LKKDGIIIFDNGDRPRFRRAIECLKETGFERLDFYGFVPACGMLECTPVFGRLPARWTSLPGAYLVSGVFGSMSDQASDETSYLGDRDRQPTCEITPYETLQLVRVHNTFMLISLNYASDQRAV
jgi:hypothetical protein